MVTGGVEMLVGVSHDQLFGPVVTVGLGGMFVEVFGDVTFRVPPFDADEAERMVRELHGFRLLEGVRGAKPADVDGARRHDHEGATPRAGPRRRRAASSTSTRWS